VAILLRHYSRALRNVTEVMYNPGRQELAEGDGSKLRMLPFERQL
jgi:hypothetical protein